MAETNIKFKGKKSTSILNTDDNNDVNLYYNSENKKICYKDNIGSNSPSIKILKLTGTTNAAEGGSVDIAHNLTGNKIISATCKVVYDTNKGVFPENTSTGLQFNFTHDATNFNIVNHATNSENILSKPFVITIIYEE